jgi:hypothetical protein
VFTDAGGRPERGLYLLAGYLRRDDVVAAVVPDLDHLTQAACLSGADRRTAQRFLRAAALTVEGEPAAVAGGSPGGRG